MSKENDIKALLDRWEEKHQSKGYRLSGMELYVKKNGKISRLQECVIF